MRPSHPAGNVLTDNRILDVFKTIEATSVRNKINILFTTAILCVYKP